MSQENINFEANNASTLVKSDESSLQLMELSADSIVLYDPDTQKEIRSLADQIDVTVTEKVAGYASLTTHKAIQENSNFLERMKGTDEDREVIKKINELASKVNTEVKDIKIAPKNNTLFTKLFNAFFSKNSKNITYKKIDGCCKLLAQLHEALQKEIDIARERANDAEVLLESHINTVDELQKYIVAGYLASERINSELSTLKNPNNSLSFNDQIQTKKISKGLGIFKIVLKNLDETRGASAVAAIQTQGAQACLQDLDVHFSMTMDKIELIFSQQAANAILHTTVKKLTDSHKNFSKLNTEFMKENSQLVAENFKNVGNLIKEGVIDPDDMLKCVEVMVSGALECNKIYIEFIENLDKSKPKIATVVSKMNNFGEVEGIETSTTNTTSNISSNNSSSSSLLKF